MSEKTTVNKKAKVKPGYTGFMYIQCERCGHHAVVRSSKPTTEFICWTCNKRMTLNQMRRMEAICKSGHHTRYWTNKTAHAFDVPCFVCGCPSTVEYHQRSNKYMSIRTE